MDNKRLCNELNQFSDEHVQRNNAHAFQLRGKYIFQSVPCKKDINGGSRSLRWFLGFSTTMAFVGFIAFQVWRLIAPPTLIIESPTPNSFTDKPEIVVSGRTAPEIAVEINGQLISSKPDGTFAQPVELQAGPNRIIISATKKHGLFTTESRTIMLKLPETVASPISLSPVPASAHPLN